MVRRRMTNQTKVQIFTYICISSLFIIILITTQYDIGAQAQQTKISENTTWTLANSPYIISGNVLVENGASLTIEPGVEVRFDGDYYIQIEGKLVAEGTEDNMITFTSNAESPAPGDWSKIRIMGNADNGSSFKYCRIEYAYTAIVIDSIVYYAAPDISNCIIQDSYLNGIEYYVVGDSTVTFHKRIDNNTILRTNDGIGMDIHFDVNSLNASLTISDNILRYNDGGIGCHSEQGEIIISHNELVDNYGSGINCHGTNVIIEYNLIANNECPGIGLAAAEGDSYLIEYNTIVNNIEPTGHDDAAIGFSQHEATTNIIFHNNNIYNNSPHDMENRREIDLNVANNWWGTIESEIIDQHIYDYYDDFNRGKLNYTPFLTEPDPDAPRPHEIINEPPLTPTIPGGHTSCLVNSSYTYVTTAEDPEGDQIRYGWDWDGDGAVDEWSDFMVSGSEDVKQHMWTTTGIYNVKVKAVDEHGDESEWSDALDVKADIVYADPDTDDNNETYVTLLIFVIIIIIIVGIVIYFYKRK